MAADNFIDIDLDKAVFRRLGDIVWPEKNFFWLAIVYGLGISVLGLATPISVQLLINSIANTALPVPLFTLAATLLVLLVLSGLLAALRIHLMEYYRRRVMARLVANITMKVINAADPFFEDERRIDLFNRYFELTNMQKAVPSLIIGGFTIILSMLVGFIVTSFYHPFFLAFNLVLIALLWAVWAIWAKAAMQTSITLSREKYNAAHWLQTVGASNGFYKSARHIDYALDRSEAVTAKYVNAHAEHFSFQFPQTIALYMLYAIASAGLLALGGWLVIQEQLSIGQLVAAELILSGVFAGIYQLYSYLDDWYDVVASVEELSLLYSLEQEAPLKAAVTSLPSGDLDVTGVRFDLNGETVRLDLTVPEGTQAMAQGVPGMEQRFARLLKRLLRPDAGLVTIGGVDINQVDSLRLRSDVVVLDRAAIVETRLADYMRLANPDANAADVLAALRLVGLEDRIAMLPDGMNTTLSSNGWPLSVAKTMQLKLAAAVLAKPRILVMSPLFDQVAVPRLQAVFRHFAGTPTTILYFSNRPEACAMPNFLWLGSDRQELTGDRARFDELRGAGGRELAWEGGHGDD